MADFCRDCSISTFGEDFGDLADLMAPEKYQIDLGIGAIALCECCGPIVVDIGGERMSKEFFPTCHCAALRKEQSAPGEE